MAPSEKPPLALRRHDVLPRAYRPRAQRRWAVSAGLSALALLGWCWTTTTTTPFQADLQSLLLAPALREHGQHSLDAGASSSSPPPSSSSAQCPQTAALFPNRSSAALAAMDAHLASPQFAAASAPRLAGAVQIATPSYDDMGAVGADPRWDAMAALAAYLAQTFPRVHGGGGGGGALRLERVNTHALLYTWPGADAALKPTVLMAHQDTVPVEPATVAQWTHPPWSGHFDGHYVWGRGAGDCKNSLVGILEAVEQLVGAGFAPRRTLVLAFGFDEETTGREGAGQLARALVARYGADGAAAVVDEGNGLARQWGALFAVPAVAEKGYLDVDVVVRVPGGHSSVPPRHTGIGVMARIVDAIEASPYAPRLHDDNPYLGQLRCGAAHAADFPPALRSALRDRDRDGDGDGDGDDRLAREAAKQSDLVKYQFTTSVAADLIRGGAKVNALPERTVLTVNHRVNVGDRTATVREHLTAVVAPVARAFNLTLHAFPDADDNDQGETPSSVTLKEAYGSALEPAPVTPTALRGTGNGTTTPYAVLMGTTRALYGEELLVAPGLSTGNTDTRFYWELSRHIFRYMPAYDPDDRGLEGIHTVDERASIRGHVKAVRWFSMFIRNMDEADL